MFPTKLTIQPTNRVLADTRRIGLWRAEDDQGDVALLYSVRGVSIEGWTARPEDRTDFGWLRGVPDSAIAAGRFFPDMLIPPGTRYIVSRPHDVTRVETTTLGALGIVEVLPVYVTDQVDLLEVLHP